MLPTSLAIAWPIWRRHRFGLIGISFSLGYEASVATLIAAIVRFNPAAAGAFREEWSRSVLLLIGFVLAFSFMYLIGVFSYGFDADLSARESCFPPGLFRLPIGTLALAGWPMVFGAAAAGL